MSKFRQLVVADWKANPADPKARLILILYRIAHSFSRSNLLVRILFSPYLIFYKILVEWFFCVEIHWRSTMGGGVSIYHGYGLVVHSACRLGKNVKLRNGVTIGMRYSEGGGVPEIGDDVDIGANACVLGGIKVGSGAKIGAGAVVLCDVPAGAVAVGNPARIIAKVS